MYCTFAWSATLAEINSESNKVSSSFLNLLFNNSSKILQICVGDERLDRYNVSEYLTGDLSDNFDNKFERNIAALFLN